MIPEPEFQVVIRRVVETCLPDEIDVLDLGGEDLVKEVYRTGRAPVTKVAAAEFELVSGAKNILELIPLAIATYKAVRVFFSPGAKKPIVTQEVMQKEWSVKLQAEGLPPAIAAEITTRFSQLVAEIVAKYQPPS